MNATEQDQQGISLMIDRETHHRLRILSVEQRTTLAALVREAIDLYLAEQAERKSA